MKHYQDATGMIHNFSEEDIFSLDEGVYPDPRQQDWRLLSIEEYDLLTHVPVPPSVPKTVTPLQARRAMRQAGVLDAVKVAVATDPEMQDAFDYATSFNREGAFISQVKALLHWSDVQMDDLFRLAASFAD